MTKVNGLELYADCTPINELKSYEGDLILNRNGKLISFEFNIKFKPNLVETVDQSNSDHNGFTNNTDLKLRYRGVQLKLSHDVKGILCSFLGEAALENARSPESQKPLEQKLSEYLSNSNTVEQLHCMLDGQQGIGISLKLTNRHAREIMYKPLDKFYQDCLRRGFH